MQQKHLWAMLDAPLASVQDAGSPTWYAVGEAPDDTIPLCHGDGRPRQFHAVDGTCVECQYRLQRAVRLGQGTAREMLADLGVSDSGTTYPIGTRVTGGSGGNYDTGVVCDPALATLPQPALNMVWVQWDSGIATWTPVSLLEAVRLYPHCAGGRCSLYDTDEEVGECQDDLPGDWNGRCAYQR